MWKSFNVLGESKHSNCMNKINNKIYFKMNDGAFKLNKTLRTMSKSLLNLLK